MKKDLKLGKVNFSVLDLAIINEGRDAADAFQRSMDLAKHVEDMGYKRFWMAEHHNMPSVGSSATAVLLAHIGGGTKSIRIGSGGIMLPNHSPLMVAEQFGTLASLFPGRVDLGLGRAPGTDQETVRALRRNRLETLEEFPQDLEDLQMYLSPENIDGRVHAIPGEGLDIPIYLLGSSMSSAALAAKKGLPYAFASHFAPKQFLKAIAYYKENFEPSDQLSKPYVISCVNVIAAQEDKEAHQLATSLYRLALNGIRRLSFPLLPPVENMEGLWSNEEETAVRHMMACSFIGAPSTVEHDLKAFQELAQVDEIMVTSHIYDHDARILSYQILAEIIKRTKMELSQ
ncbi:LLM class flavin-dependent oxidoreductase [Echinicola jeungdonensis]|uniref:LLM class flavin-dependent oxidoreductase n=1 Tax=Echinicola jeungdonensis TaxID=709343 RepID=A0ABV5J0Z8_9BACT|nr:LLM class flavin-dependent oxidoreductase [Echinicola jeungdonensis]MDN3668324.1 LLM class flavin-dependent oxidoreductase [Echinicola jeungdonensis]